MSKKRVTHILRDFYRKRHKAIFAVLFILAFITLFTVSVAGQLRIFLPYAPALTGFPFAQKNYLIVFQNNYELRPAGGFISSFATLKFQSGIPTQISVQDVYGDIDEHDYVDPPYPMSELLANQWYQGYTFRDANYYGDYPSSVEEMLKLYQLTNPDQEFDGVFAVNFNALEDIVATLGPIEVNDRKLNSSNLFEEITQSVNDVDRHNVEALENRKSILKPLIVAIIKKVAINPFEIRKLSDSIARSLHQKDIHLHFSKSSLQKIATNRNWNGAWLKPENADFFALVEANLGGMKSNRYITRDLTYHVVLTPESIINENPPKAKATLNLHHFGIENIPLSGPYTGYFRFYSQDATQDEIVNLSMGETKTIEKEFTLDTNTVDDMTYRLYIPKQSGTKGDHYTVIIELPRGWQIESSDFDTRENFAIFQGQLDRDLNLELKVLPDPNPPRLIKQSNTKLNEVKLHFNEDLNLDTAQDPFSYEVKDLNFSNEKTDQITIRNVETTSKDIILTLQGQTTQPEEHYGVRLRNLRDQSGNILNDRWITVVQRLDENQG